MKTISKNHFIESVCQNGTVFLWVYPKNIQEKIVEAVNTMDFSDRPTQLCTKKSYWFSRYNPDKNCNSEFRHESGMKYFENEKAFFVEQFEGTDFPELLVYLKK